MGRFDKFLGNFNIEVADPRVTTPKIKMLLYGMSGTGKTSLAVSASKVEELGPVLYVDLERGTAPAAKYGDLDNMLVVQPASYQQFAELLVKISKSKDMPFQTIVIDTVDRLQELIKFHWKSTKPNDSFAMWDATYEKVIDLVNKISFDLGLNIICITHESRDVNDVSRLSLIGPSFEGKQSLKKLPGIFDIIARMTWEDVGDDDNEELVTVMTVRAASELLVKARFDPIPSMSGNPTMAKIVGWVHEHCEQQGKETEEEDG
jgi:hypothetical protein